MMQSLPNILTMSRFVGVVGGTVLLFGTTQAEALWALAVFVYVDFTDWLDGYLARKYNAVTAFGKLMDPIADKANVLTVFITFWVLGVISAWWVWPIVIREVAVTVVRMIVVRRGVVIAAEKSGKLKAMMQMISQGFVYLVFMNDRHWHIAASWVGMTFDVLMYVMLAVALYLTLHSGFDFFWNNRQVIFRRERLKVKGER